MDSYYLQLRKKVGRELIVYPAAFAAIFNEKKELLLVKKRGSDLWGFPGGGIEPTETITVALKREVEEEIQTTIKVQKLMAVLSSPKYDLSYPNGDRIHPIMFLFSAKTLNNSDFTESDEIEIYEYFSQENLPSMRKCCRRKAEIAFNNSFDLVIE